MKKVLIVEDDGLIYGTIKDELGDNFQTIRVSSYAAAVGIWNREEASFDCIVLDLQIIPLGLDLDSIDTYSPLYGIAVLNSFTEGKSDEEKAKIRKKTIIYSGYVKDLYMKPFDIKNVVIINKEGDSIQNVVSQIKMICS